MLKKMNKKILEITTNPGGKHNHNKYVFKVIDLDNLDKLEIKLVEAHHVFGNRYDMYINSHIIHNVRSWKFH